MVTKESQTWILQFSPQQLDLPKYLQEIQKGKREQEGEWPIDRYFKQMQAGDRVLFWQSGPGGGFYALGELTSSAFVLSEPHPQQYISFRIQAALHKPLQRQELLQHPVLKNLTLLKRPQSRIFEVSPTQWPDLDRLFQAHGLHPLQSPMPTTGLDLALLWKNIQKSGFKLAERTLFRYHLALETGELVILSGISGIGKTWLTEVYAKHIGAAYCLVPVSPHWLSPEELLGYFNPLENRYQDTPFTQFLRQATAAYQRALKQGLSPQPYHLVLDEMNLARVEYYFAPLLSQLEIRRRKGQAQIDLAGQGKLDLPPNFFIIGTINVDHTVQAFADKVLDRAQILELSADFQAISDHLAGWPEKNLLLDLWVMLKEWAPFAYRSLDEIHLYLQRAQALGSNFEQALDEAILQKILPRLRGQGPGFSKVLAELEERLTDYPLSLAKLHTMQTRQVTDGFSSYF